MEALLGKACKQAMSSLSQMSTVLAADSSRHVCSVSTTRMLCPDLTHQLDTVVTCLANIPLILERTIQLGRENEYFFEVTQQDLATCHLLTCMVKLCRLLADWESQAFSAQLASDDSRCQQAA